MTPSLRYIRFYTNLILAGSNEDSIYNGKFPHYSVFEVNHGIFTKRVV